MILRVEANITSRSSPEERLLTMKYLVENGFITEAEWLLMLSISIKYLNEIVNYVFSPESPSHYADDLTVLLNQLRNERNITSNYSSTKTFF